MSRKGFTLIELMIVIAIIAIIAAIAIPSLLAAIKGANERNAQTSLKTVSTSQADFRSNDRDGNRRQDYWTGDVAGLFSIASASSPATPIKLIDISIAAADSAPYPAGAFGAAGGGGAQPVNLDISTLVAQGLKAGYWFNALVNDNAAAGGPAPYAVDTDGSGDLCKNSSRFGAVAWPDALGSSGNWVFIVNENNTIFRRQPAPATVLNAGGIPPGLVADPVYRDWPSDADLAQHWGSID